MTFILCLIFSSFTLKAGKETRRVSINEGNHYSGGSVKENLIDVASSCTEWPVKTLIDSAWNAVQQERYDKAIGFYTVAASKYSESMPEHDRYRCGIACVNMGYIWIAWRMNPTEAYPWLMKARNIALSNSFDNLETAVLSSIGLIYFSYNDFNKAQDYLLKTLTRLTKEKGDLYYGRSLMDYVTSVMCGGNPDFSNPDFLETLSFSLPDDAPLSSYSLKLKEAVAHINKNNHISAAKTLENADSLILLATDSSRYLAMHHLISGILWRLGGDYDRAIEDLNRVSSLASSNGLYHLLEKANGELRVCYIGKGDMNMVRHHELRMLQIRDSLFNASRFGHIKDMEFAVEVNHLNQRVNETTARAEKQRRMIIITSVAVLFFILLTIYLVVTHRKLQNAYKEIFKRNMELSETMLPRKEANQNKNRETVASEGEETATSDDSNMLLLARIKNIMESSDEIFSPDFSIERLSELTDSKVKTVSNAINQIADKNFNTFLSEYRIREACRLLADPETMRINTMETVAEKVGYRSRTHFSKIFKLVTGLTPSQFLKQRKDSN